MGSGEWSWRHEDDGVRAGVSDGGGYLSLVVRHWPGGSLWFVYIVWLYSDIMYTILDCALSTRALSLNGWNRRNGKHLGFFRWYKNWLLTVSGHSFEAPVRWARGSKETICDRRSISVSIWFSPTNQWVGRCLWVPP